MSRQIVLIAREFTAVGTELDQQTARFVDTQRELHADVHKELLSYGNVLRQRTSGIFPRVKTPPHGISRDELPDDTVLADPASHPATLRARNRKRELPSFFSTVFEQIKSAHCVVIIRDGQNDLRGAITMYVHLCEVPMLALQHEPKGIHLPGDPTYDLPNVTNIRFQNFSEAQRGIQRFMNEVPMRFAAG